MTDIRRAREALVARILEGAGVATPAERHAAFRKEGPGRATLKMLRTLARERSVDVGDMRAVLAAGTSPEQVEDALAVAFAFNIVNRLADAFAFALPSAKALESAAKFLVARGYR
jgi:hypothetical protein